MVFLIIEVFAGSAIGAGIWFVFGVFVAGRDSTLSEKTRRRYKTAGFICLALAIFMAALCAVLMPRNLPRWMTDSLETINVCATPLSMLTVAANYFFRWRKAEEADQDQRRRLLWCMIGWLTAAVILGAVTAFFYIMLTRSIANM